MKLFTEHPSNAGESYLEHARFAFHIGVQALSASLMAFTHAIFPFMFETGASERIKKLHAFLEEKGRIKHSD